MPHAENIPMQDLANFLDSYGIPSKSVLNFTTDAKAAELTAEILVSDTEGNVIIDADGSFLTTYLTVRLTSEHDSE